MTYPILTHRSGVPLKYLIQREGPQDYFKPKGLWVSDESQEESWKNWCENEQFRIDALEFRTDIYLRPDANVLWIKDSGDLYQFHRQFNKIDKKISSMEVIDWDKVCYGFSGILIIPYQCRHYLDDNCFWYYSWDCASGCIWDISAIESIQPIGE